eukprot:2290997-Amphidinium_carterae.1
MLKKREAVLLQADSTFKVDLAFLSSLTTSTGVTLLSNQFEQIIASHTLSNLADAVPDFSRLLESALCVWLPTGHQGDARACRDTLSAIASERCPTVPEPAGRSKLLQSVLTALSKKVVEDSEDGKSVLVGSDALTRKIDVLEQMMNTKSAITVADLTKVEPFLWLVPSATRDRLKPIKTYCLSANNAKSTQHTSGAASSSTTKGKDKKKEDDKQMKDLQSTLDLFG